MIFIIAKKHKSTTLSKFKSVKSLTVYKLTVYPWFENEHLAFDVAVKLFINKSNKGRVTFYYCLRKIVDLDAVFFLNIT